MSIQREIEPPQPPRRERVEVVRSLSDYRSYVETDPIGLAQAQIRVAWVYKNEFAAPDRPFISVLNDLCRDKYALDFERSKTIVLRKPDTPTTPDRLGSWEDFAGTVRVVLGKNKYREHLIYKGELESPIDELNLMRPGMDWELYLSQEDLRIDEIAGLGRLAFAEDISRTQQALVLQRLMGASFNVAREEGVKRIFAIISRQMAALLKRAGYEPTVIPDAKVQEDKRSIKKLQENYPFYWGNPNAEPKIPSKPLVLCYWNIDQPAK